jgi:hypothetical protein
MAKRKNARTKATRKATTAARKPAKTRAAAGARAKGASASSRTAGRKKTAKTAARATRKAAPKKTAKAAPKKTVKAAKKVAASRTAKSTKKMAPRAASTRAKSAKPIKTAKKAMKAAKVSKASKVTAKSAKTAMPVVAIATPPAPAKAVATNGSPAKAPAPRKAAKRDSAGARERATTRHSEPSVDRPSIPSSLNVDRSASQARTGRQEMRDQIKEHTESSPALTAGDVDADWEQAYSSGDEAPGGDNPTPDQDRVDEIGHALGVEYQDSEELKGADKISERDKHRWELDPASSEDYPDRDS